ncbi:uncharacterized protein LOC116295530 [Actinia tenebrosa]|uniref:Uncharacterized protein LOC116295530 n=1 Tax=Actinia tenebrosa TaxID=6105 RepID=A0A6P8HV33_ACTTE|nr:uncharacterized protein LOC116295530 [Actinia tenebrosa]
MVTHRVHFSWLDYYVISVRPYVPTGARVQTTGIPLDSKAKLLANPANGHYVPPILNFIHPQGQLTFTIRIKVKRVKTKYCHLETLLHIVPNFNNDINMKFGLAKCVKATFKKGKLTKKSNIQIDIDTVIKELDQEKTYKYLGIDESDGIQHSNMKEKVRKEYYRRLRLVLQSVLNAANKIQAINTLAVPVVSYSFNIIKWKLSEIKRLDAKERKFLTMNRMHHPKADVERLYVKRREGVRGLVQIENSYIKISTIGLDMYFKIDVSIIGKTKRIKSTYKDHLQMKQCEKWESNPLHDQYIRQVNKADVDKQRTHSWLKGTDLKSETEGLIIAAQDQKLPTRYYDNKIMGKHVNTKCRICGDHDETIDHVISGCPVLAKKEYIERHNKVGKYVH